MPSGRFDGHQRLPLSACGGLANAEDRAGALLAHRELLTARPGHSAKRNGPCRVWRCLIDQRPDTAGTVAFKRDRLPSEIEWKL
jgi:hypothetical protein